MNAIESEANKLDLIQSEAYSSIQTNYTLNKIQFLDDQSNILSEYNELTPKDLMIKTNCVLSEIENSNFLNKKDTTLHVKLKYVRI